MTETVTILRATPGGVDPYGDPIAGGIVEVDVPGCAVAPRMSHEQFAVQARGRQGVIVGLTLYCPPRTDLRSDDQVRVRGETYDTEGEPGDWRSPYTGVERGLEVALRRAEG